MAKTILPCMFPSKLFLGKKANLKELNFPAFRRLKPERRLSNALI